MVWFIIGPRRGCGLGTLALPLSRVDQPEAREGNIQHLKTPDGSGHEKNPWSGKCKPRPAPLTPWIKV